MISCKNKVKSTEVSNTNDTVVPSNYKKENKKSKISIIDEDEYIDFHSNGELDNIDILGDLYIFGYKIFDEKYKKKYLIFTQEVNKSKIYLSLMYGDKFGSKSIWDFKDSINKTESSIYFLKDYILVDDIDNDGLVDFIYTYSTDSEDGYDRLNIVVRYKGNIFTIKHIGATLDDERETKIDKGFYTIPKSIRKQVYNFMKDINSKVIGINSGVLKKVGGDL